ncbi:MAG: hsp70 family protein [Bryobacteraceae bacterium]|nr:hsp70 family protein [Bryobacteraceae bacterium]MDW8378652.1 Hsp70 family protein [Bryobacterales bacterium]
MNLGIDLGTTNSALAFIDPRQAGETDFPPIRVFDVPQLVAEGRIESRRTLPSFLYVAETEIIGAYAREQGALVPTRSVHSAKSWLSNPEADRTAKILPWDAQESGRIFSPVEVSARILGYLANAWNRSHPDFPIAQQSVVLTVPASFDEEARELTVQAAAEAGLERLTLLEEPAAAFYSWIANHLTQSQRTLFDGQTVLVCDVGGGTSDFTVIRVHRDGDRVDFTRTAVGKHLLLGGDNLDLTLAWLVEAKLGKPLSVRQRSALRRQCASAKETLLSDPTRKSVEITVLGAGSALVGGTLRTEITRDEALELTLEGFLPHCQLNDQPKEEKKSLFRELGLPYVSDPAITRHLAAFLSSSGVERIDAILFNGGFFIPEVCRQRVTEVVERWYGQRPVVFENQDLDLAVAVGAAYYSYARDSGSGILVRGGLPRAYFIALDGGEGEKVRTVCLAPRGTEEGAVLDLDLEGLQLVANRPVSFRLYSSLTRTDDKLGDLVDFSPEELASLHHHAPLHAVIRFGKKIEERLIPVKLGARLTEVGTLEIWAQSKVSEQRWRLQFELRKRAETNVAKPAAVVSDEALSRAEELLAGCFLKTEIDPAELPSRLEQAMALGRNSWPSSAIRKLADRLLEHASGRKLSPQHEARWLNLTGFCLRPGFGFPGDELRIEQARRIFAGGLTFANQVQCEIEWWIFWGRVAGGLNRNQQVDIYQRLAQYLLPRGQKRRRLNSSLEREMWRTASSLELLPISTRTELGEALIRKVKAGEASESDLWCIARLGARKLFYGPINQVLPASTVSRWVDALAKVKNTADTIAILASRTGDAARDLPETTLVLARRAIGENHAALAVLEGEAERDIAALGKLFGEELPSGLVIAGGTE